MYHGDIRLSETLDLKFTTVSTTGAPTTLAGTPVISAYVDNGTTELTAGITLTVDFDARTGLNHVRVVATSGNGYATGTNVQLVITTGTVGGTSVVGYEVGSFSIEKRSALMPTTIARTLDVSATGEGDANVVQWLGTTAATPTVAGVPEVDVTHWIGTAAATPTVAGVPEVDVTHLLGTAWLAPAVAGTPDVNAIQISGDATAANNLETAFDDTAGASPWTQVIEQGTAQSATGTTLVLRAALSAADDVFNGMLLAVFGSTQGYWQTRIITDYANASDTATVDAWTVTPSGTITYKIFDAAPASVTVPPAADLRMINGVAQSATDLKDFADDGYDPATNKVQGVVLVDTLTTYTGNTVQTGDSFARLGAPAGASVSADILAIDNFVDDIEARLGTPSDFGSGATVAANLVDIEAQTDDIGAAGAGLTAVAGIVWNEDATGHQTQGTFGQAIGDPAADTNTIYKAVVTDAAGATVGVDVVAIQADTDNIQTRLPAALVSGRMDASVGAMATDVLTAAALAADAVTEIRAVVSGTADSGTTTTMVDAARTEADPDYWKGALIVFTSGTIAGQSRTITAFTPGTDTVTFDPAVTQAVGTNTYEIWPDVEALRPTVAGRTLDVSAGGEAGLDWANIGSPTTAQNLSATNIDVDQVVASVSGAVGSVTAGVTLADDAITAAKYDETTAFPVKSNDAGATLIARTGADGDTLKTLSDQLDVIDDFLDTEVAAILAAVDTEVGAIKTKTDALTFTVANQVDSNIQSINDTTVIGNGAGTPWGP